MKIPKTVTVGPHQLTIRQVNQLDNCGEYDFSNLEIRIRKSMCQSAKEETYLHEVVEAINHIYELGLPHRNIQVLGAALLQALKTTS